MKTLNKTCTRYNYLLRISKEYAFSNRITYNEEKRENTTKINLRTPHIRQVNNTRPV